MRARLALALAAALLAAPARGYVRTEDPDTGIPLAWPIPVVTFRVNVVPESVSPSCTAGSPGDLALQATLAGFAAWEQSCSSLRLVYGGPTQEIRVGLAGTGENVVVFRQGWCRNNPGAIDDPGNCLETDVDCGGIYNCFEDQNDGDRGIVALTSVLYDPRNGRIMDADIEVNAWDGARGPILTAQQTSPEDGWYFTCGATNGGACGGATGVPCCADYGQEGCSFMDLQNTVTHEVGHFIGLAHVCGDAGPPVCNASHAATTMYPNTQPGDVQKRTLAADDVAGVCDVYPGGGDDGGCGSAGGTGGAALLLAAAGIGLLRQRRLPPAAARPGRRGPWTGDRGAANRPE